MMLKRRGFMGLILASAVAPAIVRASSLMRVAPAEILLPELAAVPAEINAMAAGAIEPVGQFAPGMVWKRKAGGVWVPVKYENSLMARFDHGDGLIAAQSAYRGLLDSRGVEIEGFEA